MTPELYLKVQRALEREPFDLARLTEMVEGGEIQPPIFSETGNSVVFVSVEDYAKRREIETILAAGKLSEILEIAINLEPWARKTGCEYSSVTGRVGWQRELEKLGYKIHAVVMRKKL